MIGLDYSIKEIQDVFIADLWPQLAANRKSFNHRVFRNRRDKELIPELLVDSTNDYKEVAFDDRIDVISWFDPSPTTNSFDVGQATQNVGIFFAVNLKALYPTIGYRAVEESHRDVLNLIDDSKIEGITTGKEAYGDFYTDDLKEFNMQPWHVFRINYLMSYTINC